MMLIYNFQKNKMEKVAMPDWLRNTLSAFGRFAGHMLHRFAVRLMLAGLLGKDRHHTRIGLPGVGKLSSIGRSFRAKTIRHHK